MTAVPFLFVYVAFLNFDLSSYRTLLVFSAFAVYPPRDADFIYLYLFYSLCNVTELCKQRI